MDITSVIRAITDIVFRVIPILMTIATIVFLYGTAGYILTSADEEKRKTFKSYIVWGLGGLFAMVAVWGIIRVIVSTLGIGAPWWGPGTPPYPPNTPSSAKFFNLLRQIAFYIISPLVKLMFALGTAFFLWGVIELIVASGSGNEKKMENGKKHIVWGIIGLFVMVSLWGIVWVLSSSLGPGFGELPYFGPITP